eukprot:421266_1
MLSLFILCLSQSITNAISYNDNRYAVFWNVAEHAAPYEDVTKYDILPRNWTQCGWDCSTTNCTSWNQGIWPIIEDSGQIINGGVPQAGNLSLHLDYIQQHLPLWIPNANWNGNAVIDFEHWTTIWDYNTWNDNFHGIRYQNYSIQLAAKQYPNYNSSQIYSIAKQEFETAATNWFVQTLKLCALIRPNARWGFYGLPFQLNTPCNGTGDNLRCGYQNPTTGEMYRNYSDQQIPIWRVSGALYPKSLRCAKNGGIENNLVYPFMWQEYRNHTYLSETDLNISIKLPYNLGAKGLIIWGNQSDSYVQQNSTLWKYFDAETGPITYEVVEYVNQCAQKHCSGHGRCVSLTSNTCQCDTGFSGPTCSN